MISLWDVEADAAFAWRKSLRERRHAMPISKDRDWMWNYHYRRRAYCLNRLPLPWPVFNQRARQYVRGVNS